MLLNNFSVSIILEILKNAIFYCFYWKLALKLSGTLFRIPIQCIRAKLRDMYNDKYNESSEPRNDLIYAILKDYHQYVYLNRIQTVKYGSGKASRKTITVDKVRDYGGTTENDVKQSHSGCILKVELFGLSNIQDVG